MKHILFYILFLISGTNFAFSADEYRTYIHSIDSFSSYHRVGSYKITNGKIDTPVDLYYRDSDLSPDGNTPTIRSYPNSFSLIAVYKTTDGKWTHQGIVVGARTQFIKVANYNSKNITVELSPKFMITLKKDDGLMESWQRADKINKPYQVIISLKDGKIISTRLTKKENKSQ